MRKKEKWTNNENDMHEDVHFPLTQYNYPYTMFVYVNMKNNLYPYKPQFCYIKMGLKGVKII